MKLLNLHAHNVFSIGDVKLSLKDRGLMLVTGWSYDEKNGNMAGKSSVANHCISWGLYGRTVHGIKADAVINTSIPNAKHCGVTIHFEGIDGEEYRIYRARKPNSLVLSKLCFTKAEEWEDLSKRNEKDTQELINALLGRDHKTFIQSDFFGQGRERSFLTLPGSDQKAVIEEILPLNSLDAWQAKAKQHLHDTIDEVREAEYQQRASFDRERHLVTQFNIIQSQEAGWVVTQASDLRMAQEALNKILALDSVIETEIKALRESVPPGDTVRVLKAQTVTEATLTTEINALGYKIDTLTGDIDRRGARPDVCMSCEQELPPALLKLNANALANDKTKREELVKERGEKEAKQYLAASMIAICHEIQGLETKIDSKGQEAPLREKIRLLDTASNPFSSLLTAAEKAVKLEQLERLRLGTVYAAEVQKRDHYKFWAEAYGTDLKTMIFEQVCPFLERKANQFLRDLQNEQIKVKFRTVKVLKSGEARDKFCVTAASDTGSQVFELFSGAEQQLTSFAVGMALSELASMQVEGSSQFMILDEPFLYQSPENCERIVNFVTTHLVGEKATILLISNEDNLVNLVPNRVHVVKKKGVTSIG